ncbi:MAG: DUF4383 domain-containing protein, partial [Actinomycetota bacterium]|nr:DUF4383 domain-containing protein [Actinomycetota bacterium]
MRREGGFASGRTDIERAAQLFGIIFLAVGVLGFIPGITTDYGRLDVFDDVGAKLLGVFGVNILENLVHLLYGVAGLAAGRRSWSAAKNYFIGGGAIYLALWLYGLVIDEQSAANFFGLNMAAHWLHFILGLAMV